MAITLDGSSGISSVDGSAASPSVRGADSNSGIVYAADAIKFSTGGTERFTITNTGFTGISQGITEADIWRITSGVETSAGGSQLDFNANWERGDTDGCGKIGTGMSESSGIFTFPSTGIWSIDFRAVGKKSSIFIKYIALEIQTTLNNSSYGDASQGYTHLQNNGGGCWAGLSCVTLFDVTDTSNCKCKFVASSEEVFGFFGSSTENQTYAIFTRLGDT